jgi:16S rRNA processing protein RimM
VLVVVGRIGRAHGTRGDVTVDVRTDEPDERFAPGTQLVTEPVDVGPLTVADARMHSGRLLLRFESAADRTAAEGLRGVVLLADVDAEQTPQDPAEFYDRQLVGLRVMTVEGLTLGSISSVVHGPAQDLLVVRSSAGQETLVPFVTALVPRVDIEGGFVIVDPPPGLLELETSR